MLLCNMNPGSGGLKALHLDQANQPYFLRLSPRQTWELQARVGDDPVTKKYVQVWSQCTFWSGFDILGMYRKGSRVHVPPGKLSFN